MSEILGTVAPTGGFIASLVAMFWLVYTGKLIPGSWVETLLAKVEVRAAAAEADRDHWRQVAETSASQVNELLATTRVTAQVLQSLPSRDAQEESP